MIEVLKPEVVNQIAAGEVVERPFSVLKECVENSIDAGAKRIDILLEEGGKQLIRIQDDGRGMSPEDLGLAFVSHATSKLRELGDLEAIISLGFRGEALASIGSVARVRILSRTLGAEAGAVVRSEGGRISEVVPAASPHGTLVEVRDLFFNVPARRRFLKSTPAEKSRCLEVLTKLALAHPEIGFRVEGSKTFDLVAEEEPLVRIGKLFGKSLRSLCHPVDYQAEGILVSGFAVDPDGARRDRSQEFLFLNGRPIKDRSLSFAIRDAYREFLMGGRFPVTFLHLQMDPGRVDVNAHPTKTEVRFHQPRLVFSTLRRAVLEALGARRNRLGAKPKAKTLEAGGASTSPRVAEDLRPATGFPGLPKGLFGQEEAIGSSFGTLSPREGIASSPSPSQASLPGGSSESTPTHLPTSQAASCLFQKAKRFLVIRDLYILLETDEGFAIIDQHALHERILYEKLLGEWQAGEIPVQGLLVPLLLELPPADHELLIAHCEALEKLGLRLSDFGGNTIKLEGYPHCLRRVDPKSLVEDVLQSLQEGRRPDELEEVRERFHSAACRAAVMSGDRLSDTEIQQLLMDAASLEHPDNCPHGRPTVLNFSTHQLETWFRRK
jgi:DNA mismatch repair protein MutL